MSTESRRLFILQILLLLTACASDKSSNGQLELVIGVISYEEGKQAIERFAPLRKYLGDKLGALIQLEPTFNEKIAIERIQRRTWSLVFASPGLAAITIAEYQYFPIFPFQYTTNSHSIFIVLKNSSLRKLKDLEGKIVALGQPGSATGYYFPLYNLYGLTLAEILLAPTPKTVLEWVAQGKAAAGAISLEEFYLHRRKLAATEFRILFSDSETVPPGAVLIGQNVEIKRQELIRNYLKEAPPTVVQDVGYLPNSEPPDYRYMISVVKRVASINARLNSKPARLF
ncbi:MAG: PhnD/SsuA/transferrin family substrate-binding protein [Stigonema ocellatum SAG 48.90 = DSM 106950]|nr:PhnD/SsuA/transferrin family substrate-binding protein [Stigonema ocellatum SAG 48.90 = DSM 106950]